MKSKSSILWCLVSGILILGLTACAAAKQKVGPSAELASVRDIQVVDRGDKTEITIEGDRPLVYTSYELTNPQRLIVDLAGTSLGQFQDLIPILKGAAVDLLPIEGDPPSHVARLEIALMEPVPSQIRAEGNKLILSIDRPAAEPTEGILTPPAEVSQAMPIPPIADEPSPITAEPSPIPPSPAPVLPKARIVSKVSFETRPDRIDVQITGDGVLSPEAFMVQGNRLVVDLLGVTNAVRPNTIPVKHSLVRQIRIGQHAKPEKVRVVFDLTAPVRYTMEPAGDIVSVSLMAGEPPKGRPAVSADKRAGEIALEKPSGTDIGAAQAPPIPTQEAVPLPAPMARETVKREEVTAEKRYVGRKISLDFQDAEITNVLRLLADVSGFNIVMGDDVKGKISLKLINVPWDQALDIVLKMRNLGEVREGNIIRVATLANISKQQDDEARAKETKMKAEDLITKVIYVNYAKAEDLSEPLKKNLSPRGDITIDLRTNTMIVKDISRNINDILSLVKTLDTRTPQVQIEARIVQADTSFAQSLGIQWGLGFSAIRSNNLFSLQGVNSASTTQPGFSTFAPDFAVNLPGTVSGLGAVPSMGFNFGRFTDNPVNLDLRLSAGELNGLTKTISSPKVTTLDNVKAKIEQGESIPFQTTSLQGTQTTFVDANLTLEVTPHITRDRSIIMKVKAARNSLGSFSGPAGPSISKREATTQVLVKDGETTVIGGIFVDESKDTTTGIPLLSRIPILGWLFKNETKTDAKNELLIFLTPRIVKEE